MSSEVARKGNPNLRFQSSGHSFEQRSAGASVEPSVYIKGDLIPLLVLALSRWGASSSPPASLRLRFLVYIKI